MRILHVIPAMEAEDGGPTAAVEAMVYGIAARGAQVTVATTAPCAQQMESRPADRIKIVRFPRTVPGRWKYSRSLGRWLRENIACFDVVHVHALFSYATIPACRAAIAHHIPLVLRPLGTLDEWSLSQGAWKKGPYLRLVERRHLGAASVIHVTSELERRSVAALGYGDRARVIPLGVHRIFTVGEVENARAQPGNRGPLKVLFLSRLHPKKGLPLLIAALGQLRRDTACTLRVAGSGPLSYVAELKQRCADAGITDTTAFLGHVAREEKERLLMWADVFVLPSYQENFALAAAEAMAAGVPLILSDNVGIARDAGEAGAAIVVPAEVSAISSALRRLASDPNLRLRMALQGRALAERKFTWTATSDALMNLYEELRRARVTASVG